MNHREAARILACVAGRLQEERERLGLTLQKFESLSGISRRMMISMVEKGERSPSLIICLRVAGALGLHLVDVLNSVPAKKDGRRK